MSDVKPYAETKAIKVILEALEPLTSEQRSRVVSYVRRRLESAKARKGSSRS